MATAIHRIWFGSNPIPGDYEEYWSAWQRQHPDCEFITWTDADIARLDLSKPALERFSSNISRADLARYEILYKFGGLYLDCDIMPYNHFSPSELCSQLTVCNETEAVEYCSIGFIGAPAGHPIFRELIDHILASDVDETRPNLSTGPWLFGEQLKRHAHRRLPVSAFYPYLYDEPFSSIRKKDLENTLGIHVWGGAWLPPEDKKSKALDLLSKGDIVEPAAILAKFDDPGSNGLKCAIEVIQDVRVKAAEVALFLDDDLSVDGASRAVFEFGKVVHWLLEQDADRMVWQIGAADEILVDPLRPCLVNFDPPAMLLEPDPYLFRMLEKGYRNNRNATLLQLAYSSGEAELILNAINPDKAAELNLPHWVLGISSVYDDKNAIGGLTIDEALTRQIQSCIERIAVPVTGFSGLLELAKDRRPEILVIDAEGMDKLIIDDLLAHGCRPAVIHFEIQCMDQDESRSLIADLSADYIMLEFGNDITAYRRDIFLDYAKSLYIHNGIPTIFAPALVAMNGLAPCSLAA